MPRKAAARAKTRAAPIDRKELRKAHGGAPDHETRPLKLVVKNLEIARASVKGAAVGLMTRAQILTKAGHLKKAFPVYDEIVARLGKDSDPLLREVAAGALVLKAYLLVDLDRKEEALAVCDDATARFGKDNEPGVRKLIAELLLGKAALLRDLDRKDKALATYEQIARNFGEDSNPALREMAVRALVNKAVLLRDLDRKDGSRATYEKIARDFGNDSNPALREIVKQVLTEAAGETNSPLAQPELGDHNPPDMPPSPDIGALEQGLKQLKDKRGFAAIAPTSGRRSDATRI